MAKNRKKSSWVNVAGPIAVAVAGVALLTTYLLRGTNVALFNPKGTIAQQQHSLTMLVVGIMLILAIPVVFLFYFTAWKYRETNQKAKRDPDAGQGKLVNAAIWGVPLTFMLILTAVLWPATERLAPQKAIAKSGAKPLTVQVIALRWKWLFIYPEQKIATVNYLQIPTDTPVTFELTADDAPMSSFWIPNLGGMLYAMTGHVNRLNLLADTVGTYTGSTAEINGAGFSRMKFDTSVTSQKDFDMWVQNVGLGTNSLTSAEYATLLKPSEDNPQAFYKFDPVSDLYATVVKKYDMGHAGHAGHEGH